MRPHELSRRERTQQNDDWRIVANIQAKVEDRPHDPEGGREKRVHDQMSLQGPVNGEDLNPSAERQNGAHCQRNCPIHRHAAQ